MILYDGFMSNEERRSFKRIDSRLQVKYEVVDANSLMPLTTYTKNVSCDGLLFRSNNPVGVGTIMKLRFYLDNFNEFIAADARVVRVEEIVEGKIYDIGVKLINVGDDSIEKLTGYVTKKK